MATKPDIKIAQGGEMIGASGELIRWKASNSIRLSVQTQDLNAAQEILSSAVQQVLGLVPNLHDLDHFSDDLENFYVVQVSVSQPRRQDDMPSGGSQSRLEAQPLNLEDDEDDEDEDEEGEVH
jgi:hypothetical protein